MTTSPITLLHTNQADEARAVVAAKHPDLTIHTCDSYAALPDALAETGAEVIYTVRFDGTPNFPRQALLNCPTVRWVSNGGSGCDHITPWDASTITVTNAAGVAADMMAEYCIGGMLHFSLGLDRFRTAQNAREWTAGSVAPIAGKTVLIIGLGHTGVAVAKRARAMGLTVLATRARPAPHPAVDEVYGSDDLPALWSRADFVVLATPLLPTTKGIMGAEAFAALKPGAVLLDVSRGGVADEAALLNALDSGKLRGAALDVFATEPLPSDHRLWSYENVIITPHCSSVFDGWEAKSVEMFADNLTRYRAGAPLTNIVDPTRGY
ncbi:MAG: D-2-hydroxyacid dehydrogenase [Pikeienuella sp.]